MGDQDYYLLPNNFVGSSCSSPGSGACEQSESLHLMAARCEDQHCSSISVVYESKYTCCWEIMQYAYAMLFFD